MEIRAAGAADVGHLAELIARFDGHEPGVDVRTFEADLRRWWDAHRDTHLSFLALHPSDGPVGMAWLALTARVLRPGGAERLCGDVQSLYVVPEHRPTGVGTALTLAVLEHGETLGLEHVTVHSSERAVSLYERAGFAPSRELLLWSGG